MIEVYKVSDRNTCVVLPYSNSIGHRLMKRLQPTSMARHVDASRFIHPLVRYMRWSSHRREDAVYRIEVPVDSISQIKLFPPDDVPVTGREAVSGSVGGPWDRLTMSVRRHYLHRSIRAHLNNGVSWEDTPIYSHPKYRDDPERARRRCEKIEWLIEAIRAEGYRSQEELDEPAYTSNEWVGEIHVGDEIIVGLDRDGRYIQLMNGRHRLAISQVLDIGRIPVVLSLVHPRCRDAIPADSERLEPSLTESITGCNASSNH